MIELTTESIDIERMLQQVSDEHCGATVLFLGSTRRWTKGKETARLEYEAYAEMAKDQMEQLETEARGRWPIRHVVMVHRLGEVGIGQTSVAVAVGSPHREAAFAAGKWLIDTLKKDVPIWKKEIFVGEPTQWIHPTEGADQGTIQGTDQGAGSME